MYKITRIKEISIEFSTIVEELINRYIDEELQEDEFLIDVKYFKVNHTASNLNFEDPFKAHLIIGKLIK